MSYKKIMSRSVPMCRPPPNSPLPSLIRNNNNTKLKPLRPSIKTEDILKSNHILTSRGISTSQQFLTPLDQCRRKIKYLEQELLKSQNEICSLRTKLGVPLFEKMNVKQFKLISTIGQGHMGPVQLCRGHDNRIFVCKVMQRENIVTERQQQHVVHEIHILRQLSHPFIGELYGTFKTSLNICLILEPFLAGDMFTFLQFHDVTEKQVIFYVQCLTMALCHIHGNSIIHRDIKTENIMMTNDGYVKLIDFGYAKMFYDERTRTFLGTPEYLAPEITTYSEYGISVDWWALGIFMYDCIQGNTPFYNDDRIKIIENIQKKDPIFTEKFTNETKQIIKGLLAKDPINRYNSLDLESLLYQKISKRSLLEKMIKAPYIPRMRHSTDTSNFDIFERIDWNISKDPPYTGHPIDWDYYI